MRNKLALVGAIAMVGSMAVMPSSALAKARTGGTVVVALAPDQPPNWFVPVFSAAAYTEINAQIQFLMYRPLVYLNKESNVDYSKSLAKSIVPSKNGTVYTITLSHKYRWSNGSPITAQDVVFTWDLIHAASQPHSPWVYGAAGSGGVPKDWKSVVAKGNNVVVVTLNKPANPVWFIHNGLSQISPIPKASWNRFPTNMTKELRFIESVANSPTNPVYKVVDGPFRFKSWQADNDWVLVPNPKFGGHRASISKLVFQYETSNAQEFSALKQGTVSLGYLPPSMFASKSELTGDKLSSDYLFGMNYMVPNFSPKAPGGMGTIFSNLYVRQALQMGINQPGIIRTLYHGAGVPTDGPIPSVPATIYRDPALNKSPYPYNPKAGKKLLEKHGWREVHGVMTKGGKKLSFTLLYSAGDISLASTVQLIKSSWAQEGIQLSLLSMPLNQVLAEESQTDANKWQMAYWGAGWTYQLDYYPTGGNLFATGAGENGGGYSSQPLDKLIQQTYLPGSPAQIKARMDAYQAFMAKNLPVLWMPWFPMGYARVTGYTVHADNLHGTVKTFNPVTDYLYANYWTVSS